MRGGQPGGNLRLTLMIPNVGTQNQSYGTTRGADSQMSGL